MTFLEKHSLGTNPSFRARVEIALVKTAIAVMTEDPSTDGHDLRATYAKRVLDAPATASGPAALAVATGYVTEDSSDDDLEFTVHSMFSAFAGHSTGSAEVSGDVAKAKS